MNIETTSNIKAQKPRENKPLWSDSLPDTARSDGPVAVFIVLFVLGAAWLVIANRFPPVLDFPNHFARMWLLGGGIEKARFPEIYSLDWARAHTNIGIDFVASLHLLPAEIMPRVMLFMAIVLPPLGAYFFHRVIFKGAFAWQAGILALAWCSTLVGGFLNFQIGLGLALLFAAVEARIEFQSPVARFAFRSFAAAVQATNHVLPLFFYMALAAGLEFGPTFRAFGTWKSMWNLLGRLGSLVLACMWPLMALALSVKSLPGAHAPDSAPVWADTLRGFVLNLASAFVTYEAKVDITFVMPVILIACAAIVVRRFSYHAGLVMSGIGLFVLACIVPQHALGTGFIGWRFPIMSVLALYCATCAFPDAGRRQAMVIVCILGIAGLGRVVWIDKIWRESRSDVEDVLAVLKSVKPGSNVLPLMKVPPSGRQFRGKTHRYFFFGMDDYRHLPLLAIPFANAFVPTLFTAPGKQPLATLGRWSRIAVPEGDPPTVHALTCPELTKEPVPYLQDWPQVFDYVLVINAGGIDALGRYDMPVGLEQVASTDFAELYAVTDRSALANAPKCPGKINPRP